MKIKRFNEMADTSLARDIAEDLLPKLQLKRSEGVSIKSDYLEKMIVAGGGDIEMTDKVMSELVDMGFDFDIENDLESEDCGC